MRVYTATYLNRNYGSFLQAYALQYALKLYGADPTIIQRKKSRIIEPKAKRILRFLKPQKHYSLYRRIKLKIQDKCFEKKYCRLDSFKNQKLNVLYIDDLSYLKELLNNEDILLAGSDQIWSLATGSLSKWYTFQCDDLPEQVRKFSYAASIGLSELSLPQIEQYKDALKDFSVISFREHQAKDLLETCFNKDVRCDLDPTLLLDSNMWDSLSSPRLINEPYIFIYMLRPDKRLISIGKKIAKTMKCRVIYTGLMADQFDGVETICDAGVEDFLSYIRYAEGVITNSFHGTVFSIIFRRNFISMKLEGTSSRVENLLNLLQLKSQYVENYRNFNAIYNEINYESVMENLSIERNKSLDYLKKICSGAI